MKRNKKFRENGAVGAILDEYEKAIHELKDVIANVSKENLNRIVDNETENMNCKSIQTILSHVVGAGYNYVIAIRKWHGEEIDYPKRELLDSAEKYKTALEAMFSYNVKLFTDYPDLKLLEYEDEKKINVRWGQKYDAEQLFEHAIVHVLRHRRQIERFLIKLENM